RSRSTTADPRFVTRLRAFMSAALLVLTVAAPITQVTVYSDRARVVRTAHVSLSGRERVEFPLLPDAVDPATIRVEAASTELERVDIERVDASDFPQAKARELLAALDALDDQLARARGQRAAWEAPLGLLRGLSPALPAGDVLRPPPRLDATGWGAAL